MLQLTALTGLLLSGLLITALIRSFQLSFNQLLAADYVRSNTLLQRLLMLMKRTLLQVSEERMNNREMELAARLIQGAFRVW